jgi:hypothetical protein
VRRQCFSQTYALHQFAWRHVVPFLLLASVAEPDAQDFLVQMQHVGQKSDFLDCRPFSLVEMLFQNFLDWLVENRPPALVKRRIRNLHSPTAGQIKQLINLSIRYN